MTPEWILIIALILLLVVGAISPSIVRGAVGVSGGRVARIRWSCSSDANSEGRSDKQVLYHGVLATLVGPLLVGAALVVPGRR
jgi:hypothetical protein